MNVMTPTVIAGKHTDEELTDDPQAGRVPVPGDVIGGGDLGAVRAVARGPHRDRETPLPARRCGGTDAARFQAADAMTGNRITIPAGPARRCARCGALGTHYLTCPILRLPRVVGSASGRLEPGELAATRSWARVAGPGPCPRRDRGAVPLHTVRRW